MRTVHTHHVARKVASVGPGLRVNGPSSGFGRHVTIGTGCHFNAYARILGGGRVVIGDYVHAGEQLTIITQNHDFDHGDAIPYGKTVITKDVAIGNFVWLGDSVIVLPGTRIGDGAIVGAGAVVSKTIPDCAIVVGNPCRIIRSRDVERFHTLRAQGRFH